TEHRKDALISLLQPENQASREVAEALGMECGEPVLRNGHYVLVYRVQTAPWHAISYTCDSAVIAHGNYRAGHPPPF
ncbi:hypothetical protein R0K05_25955, partial [Planococcus sp. SIMBA_160]